VPARPFGKPLKRYRVFQKHPVHLQYSRVCTATSLGHVKSIAVKVGPGPKATDRLTNSSMVKRLQRVVNCFIFLLSKKVPDKSCRH
jgi:hypothetical protein